MADEQWRVIPGLEGRYSVSDHGRIKVNATGELRKVFRDALGYEQLTFRVQRKTVCRLVHRLVAGAFLGQSPEHVCHNDGNPSNNHVSNLRYDTRKGNMADKWKHGTQTFGESHVSAKLTTEQVLAIRRDRRSSRAIAPEYGIGDRHVRDIRAKRKWIYLP